MLSGGFEIFLQNKTGIQVIAGLTQVGTNQATTCSVPISQTVPALGRVTGGTNTTNSFKWGLANVDPKMGRNAVAKLSNNTILLRKGNAGSMKILTRIVELYTSQN